MNKWAPYLLVLLVLMQGMTVHNQSGLRTEMINLRQRQEADARQNQLALSNLDAALREREAVPEWLTRPEVTVTPDPTCREHRVSVSWSLREWTPGTRSHLQYRRGAGDAWQEATVRDLGQQSYAAEVPITGGPGLLWRVHVTAPNRTGPAMVYWPPEAEQFRAGFLAEPALQYRILADVPGGSRAAAPQPIVLGHSLTIDATLSVTAGANNSFEVTALTPMPPANPCVAVGSLVARPKAGDQPLGEFPLQAQADRPGRLAVQFTTQQAPTGIDVAVQYGQGLSTVIPVNLAR